VVAQKIKEHIEEALKKLGVEQIDFIVEHPLDISHGDYASNVAIIAGKKTGRNPNEVAQELIQELTLELFEKVEVAGPGFINFHLSRDFFSQSISEIRESGEEFGRNENLKGKKIIVEYAQPNLFKVFHIGHLMGTTIGESLSRILSFSGANVIRANYQGDVGLHIAKALWGIKKNGIDPNDVGAIGEAYTFGSEAYENDEKAKIEIIEINKKIYEHDKELMDVYKKGRESSLKGFDEMYKLLGTEFDEFFFESDTWEEGKKLVEEGLEKGIFEESDGAIIFPGEKYGLHTRVFITKEGIPTYEAKDLGLIILKSKKNGFDENITETGIEQDQYFDVVFKSAELLRPEFSGRLKHLHHGIMSLTTGKMSSRTGKVILAKPFIEEMIKRATEKVSKRGNESASEIAEIVAVGAIKYMILKQGMNRNIIFDPEKSLSFEGDSGPYLQYTYVRAKSVLAKAVEEGVTADTSSVMPDTSLAEKLLYRFPEVVNESIEQYAPQKIVHFLTSIASAFNGFYAEEKIVDKEDEYSSYKVALTGAVATVLKNGLFLLGIKVPDRM